MSSGGEKLTIGASTGWFYGNSACQISKQEAVLKRAGLNGVEICLVFFSSDDERVVSLAEQNEFDRNYFVCRSLHLFNFVSMRKAVYEADLAKRIVDRHHIDTALIHPAKTKDGSGGYPIAYYENMLSRGIPLAVENMNARQGGGYSLEDLGRLVNRAGLRFVLDAQHAYEHDPEMKYADELFSAFESSLVHLHVSGETDDETHALLHKKARNAGKVMDFIGRVLSRKVVPLIIEGKFETAEDLRKEARFLRKELGYD